MTRPHLLIDGANVVMFAAFGGKIAPEAAARSAQGMIARAVIEHRAKSALVVFDAPVPSFRKTLYPAYKAGRTTDTQPYINALQRRCHSSNLPHMVIPGFEADDVLASLATRHYRPAVIMTTDSDLLAHVTDEIKVYRMRTSTSGELWGREHVVGKYGIEPCDLPLYKAIMGEKGDNIPGLPGYGPKRTAALLTEVERSWLEEEPFRSHLALTLPLTTLKTDVPL